MLMLLFNIGVYYMFGLLDCVCYNENFVISGLVISRFCSIHLTLILFGLKNAICNTRDFVKSRFYCNNILITSFCSFLHLFTCT